MPKNKLNPDIVWHSHKVSRYDREKLKNQKGFALWLTGLSGCGKSTIANILEETLNVKNYHTYLIDGDNVRHGLSAGLGFTEEDRVENIRRVAETIKLFVDAGIIVIASFISPLREHRQVARKIIGAEDFLEIFIDSPFCECVKRDPKGWYKKAFNGEIDGYTGVDAPYEKPESPDMHINSNELGLEEGAARIMEVLRDSGFLSVK